MNGLTAMTGVALAWYRREDWDRLRQMAPGRKDLHATYDEWLKEARRVERTLKGKGTNVRRVTVDLAELAVWCALRGLEPVEAARSEFVSEKMSRSAGRETKA